MNTILGSITHSNFIGTEQEQVEIWQVSFSYVYSYSSNCSDRAHSSNRGGFQYESSVHASRINSHLSDRCFQNSVWSLFPKQKSKKETKMQATLKSRYLVAVVLASVMLGEILGYSFLAWASPSSGPPAEAFHLKHYLRRRFLEEHDHEQVRKAPILLAFLPIQASQLFVIHPSCPAGTVFHVASYPGAVSFQHVPAW
jgi:hypothetical protein